jgi:uncharacterized SAM-binding protein YcdF (DUF218 family)
MASGGPSRRSTYPNRPTPRRRISRPWRYLFIAVCILLITWLVGGYFVVVHPVTNILRQADAIVVLGSPDVDGRQSYAFTLAEQDYASTIAISVGSRRQLDFKTACHNPPNDLTVLCFVPNPPTTKGEAHQIRTFAAQYHWKSVIVVTSSYHISRARMIIGRCFGGDVMMSAPAAQHSIGTIAYQYVYQTAGYLKALTVDHGC